MGGNSVQRKILNIEQYPRKYPRKHRYIHEYGYKHGYQHGNGYGYGTRHFFKNKDMYTAMTQEKYYMNIYIYSIINIIILLLNIQNESTCNEWVRAFLFIYK